MSLLLVGCLEGDLQVLLVSRVGFGSDCLLAILKWSRSEL